MARNQLRMPLLASLRFHRREQDGFTLIELLIVVTLTVMLMLSASALFMTFLISGGKANTIQLVKNEGDHALNQMEFLLRNAIELQPNPASVPNPGQTCLTTMNAISFKSLDGGVTTLYAQTDTDNKLKIASNSGIFLTSGNVTLTGQPTFSCATSSDDRIKYVTITFTLRKGTPGVDQARDIVEQTFRTGVSIRSY